MPEEFNWKEIKKIYAGVFKKDTDFEKGISVNIKVFRL
jgi:hypothetical protein